MYVDGEPAGRHAPALVRHLLPSSNAPSSCGATADGPFVPIIDWAKEFARRKGYPRVYCTRRSGMCR